MPINNHIKPYFCCPLYSLIDKLYIFRIPMQSPLFRMNRKTDDIGAPILSFLKIRAGYGTSAGYPQPYRTRNTLLSATNVFVTAGGSILNGNSVSPVLGNPELKPELHEEIEVGLDVKLLNNIIGIDLSLPSLTIS